MTDSQPPRHRLQPALTRPPDRLTSPHSRHVIAPFTAQSRRIHRPPTRQQPRTDPPTHRPTSSTTLPLTRCLRRPTYFGRDPAYPPLFPASNRLLPTPRSAPSALSYPAISRHKPRHAIRCLPPPPSGGIPSPYDFRLFSPPFPPFYATRHPSQHPLHRITANRS